MRDGLNELDPKTGMLKKLRPNSGDPRCHCPRACGFHATQYSPHEKPGSRAAQRRLRQAERMNKFPCAACGELKGGPQYQVNDKLVCEDCVIDGPTTIVEQELK